MSPNSLVLPRPARRLPRLRLGARLTVLTVWGCLGLLLAGCGRRVKVSDIELVHPWHLVELPPAPTEPLAPVLRLLIWRNYLDPAILERFTEHYGVKFEITFFENNSALKRLFNENPNGYDLIMPSAYVVEELITTGRIAPIDKSLLPNLAHVATTFFQAEYDRELTHSVPLFYSYLGVAFNSDYLRHLPEDFRLISESREENLLLHGYRALLDEARITLAITLAELGYGANSTDPEALRQATDHLVKTSGESGIHFMSDALPAALANNEILIAVCWGGAAGAALAHNQSVRFVLPNGSQFLEIDSMVIPVSSPHARTAHYFLNYLLIPEIAGALTNYSYYANTNDSSRPFVAREILLGPSYLNAPTGSSVFIRDIDGFEANYDAAWDRLNRLKPTIAAKIPLRTSPRVRAQQDDIKP